MANPTGTTYLQANASYVWADGDVYQIPQTDQVEGAATGASFGGQGVENYPHLLLLNKIQRIRTSQLADEQNIATLQQQILVLSSSVGPSGWFKANSTDAKKGNITIVAQWGLVTPQAPPTFPIRAVATTTFAFPIAFPNAVFFVVATPQVNIVDDTVEVQMCTVVGLPTPTQFTLETFWDEASDAYQVYFWALGW